MIQVNAVVVQEASTIVLVLATLYYAIQTRATVKEISNQRKDNLLPIIFASNIVISKENNDDYGVDGSFVNIGNGPGFAIRLVFLSMDTGKVITESESFIDYINKGSKKAHVHIPKTDWDKLKFKKINGEEIAGVYLRIHADDFYGRINHTEQCFVIHKNNKVEPILGSFEFMRVNKRQKLFLFLKRKFETFFKK